MTNKIKAIGFDYAGVIGGSEVVGRSFTRTVCEELDMDIEEYRKVYFGMNNLINTGQKTPKEFWQLFLDEVGKSNKLNQVLNIWDTFENKLLQVSDKMIQLVKNLRTNSYKVGLFSNATSEFGNTLRSMGLDKNFDVFLISGDIGLMKPDPKAFKIFVDKLGIAFEEFVFIDDAEKSLSTASECGFHPILFRSYEDLILQLQSLGVVISI